MTKEQPKISVIIPTHNRASLVTRAIASVLGQSYQNLECIVVDDASSDSTREVVASIRDTRLVYLHNEKSKRASGARNVGLNKATGEFVAFLDDDDEWLPTKLEKQMQLMLGLSRKIGMIYCWMDYYDEAGNIIKMHHPTVRGYAFEHVFDEQRIGGCPTLLVRKTVADEINGFDENLPRGNDGDFIRRVCYRYDVDFVPEVLVKVYTEHGFERITNTSPQGLKNAIRAYHDRLDKFKDVLDRYPRQTANIYAQTAFHYGMLHDWRQCLTYYAKALRTAPSSSTLLLMLKSLKRIFTGPDKS